MNTTTIEALRDEAKRLLDKALLARGRGPGIDQATLRAHAAIDALAGAALCGGGGASDEREAFEAWARRHGLGCQLDVMKWEWTAWQARAAIATPPAEVVPVDAPAKRAMPPMSPRLTDEWEA